MNGSDFAILSIDHHSTVGDQDRYVVMFRHPSLEAPYGPPVQTVATEDRQAIADKIKQVTRDMCSAEVSGNPAVVSSLAGDLKGLGMLLCNTYIPAEIKVLLRGLSCPLAISTELNDQPWELLHPGTGDFLALQVPLVRSPVVQKYKDGVIDEALRRGPRVPPLKALVASNPGQPPLPCVDMEATTLASLFAGWNMDVMRMGQDLKDGIELRAALAKGLLTFLHFAGHGHFDGKDPANSSFKILTASGSEQSVTAQQLHDNIAGAPLLFLNACESARQAGNVRKFQYLAGQAKGFASVVIAGGAIGFVGTQWPVLDLSAVLFAMAFYHSLLQGKSLGQAMLHARQASARGELANDLRALLPNNVIPEAMASEVTWANFVLYGRPDRKIA